MSSSPLEWVRDDAAEVSVSNGRAIADLSQLEKRGLVEIVDNRWRVTERARQMFLEAERQADEGNEHGLAVLQDIGELARFRPGDGPGMPLMVLMMRYYREQTLEKLMERFDVE